MQFEVICQDILIIETRSSAKPEDAAMEHLRKVKAVIDSCAEMFDSLRLPNNKHTLPDRNRFGWLVGEIRVIQNEPGFIGNVMAYASRTADYTCESITQLRDSTCLSISTGDRQLNQGGEAYFITEVASIMSKVTVIDDEAEAIAQKWILCPDTDEHESEYGLLSYLLNNVAEVAFEKHRCAVRAAFGSEVAKRNGVYLEGGDSHYVFPQATENTNFYFYEGFSGSACAYVPLEPLASIIGLDMHDRQNLGVSVGLPGGEKRECLECDISGGSAPD